MAEQQAKRVLGGIEDGLYDASAPNTVTQDRGGAFTATTVTKIHAGTLPYTAKMGDPSFVSIKDQIDSNANKAKVQNYPTKGNFPPVGDKGSIYIDEATKTPYYFDGTNYVPLAGGIPNGATIGSNGQGDAVLQFYDDNSNTPRSIMWDDSRNGFVFEDNNGTMHLLPIKATQTEVDNGTNDSKYVTPKTLAHRTASATKRGLVELATTTEARAGSDTSRAVTPKGLDSVLDSRARVGTKTGVPVKADFNSKPADIIFDRSTGKSYWLDGGTVKPTASGSSGGTAVVRWSYSGNKEPKQVTADGVYVKLIYTGSKIATDCRVKVGTAGNYTFNFRHASSSDKTFTRDMSAMEEIGLDAFVGALDNVSNIEMGLTSTWS